MKKSFLIIIIALVVIFVRYLFAPVFNQLELISYDWRSKMALDGQYFAGKFKPADKSNIVIIEVDDYSKIELSKHPDLNLGPWPWRRDVWSTVVKYLERSNPKAILFDLIFSDNAQTHSFEDTKLSWMMRSYDNVVIATSLNHPKSLVDKYKTKDLIKNSDFLPTSKSLDVVVESKKMDDKITYYSHSPINDIYTKYTPTGVVNAKKDKDNLLRTNAPLYKLIKNDKTYYIPSLAFSGFLMAMGDDEKITLKEDKIVYKNREIPLDKDGQMNISWHGKGRNYTFVPISSILIESERNKLDPSIFKDKIIFIGRTETGTDVHATPVSPVYLGTETVATTLDNMLNDTDPENTLARKIVTAAPVYVEYVFILAACLLIVAIGVISKNPFVGLLNGIWVLILYILGCIYVFSCPTLRLWVPMIAPLYYMIATSAVLYSIRLQSETSKKTEIMNTFGKFVSPSVLDNLLANSNNLVLKSSKKLVTVMFCDVKDFTTLSEKSDPDQLVENINELFNEIVNIIFANNGTVDKFVGDCIMAFWGDPVSSGDDAYMAVKTALEIKKKVNELKLSSIKEGKIVLDVKIGINTGEALMGLVGSNRLMSYTAMGDAVNTAARLESACSKLQKDLLISKSTYDEVKDRVVAIDAGVISVKGKEEQVGIFEPISLVVEEKKDAQWQEAQGENGD